MLGRKFLGQLGDGSNSGSLATYVVGLTSIVQVGRGPFLCPE